ncbi:MAG: DUF2177 family protein [Gudongella sp.]|nr:DUF2177 family protein [Gudongella sp.]
MNYIKMYLITLIIFFAIDILWLGFIAKDIYKEHLGFLMREKPNWSAAVIFYMVYIVGLLFFVLNPALQKDSLIYGALVGAFFGFITYATYDMTNLATLKDWPMFVTVVDIIWGTVLCSATTSISFIILRAIGV